MGGRSARLGEDSFASMIPSTYVCTFTVVLLRLYSLYFKY